MSLPAIPRVEDVRKAVIDEMRKRAQHRQTADRGQPAIARCTAPDFHRAGGPDEEPAGVVAAVQPPANIFQARTKLRQRFRLGVDVAELDGAGAHCGEQAVTLPVDAGVTDRTFGIVPDRKRGQYYTRRIAAPL